VRDEGWAGAGAYFTLLTEAAPQREYSVRAGCNAPRGMARTGAARRMRPQDFPPWPAVYHQTRRRPKAGGCEAMVEAVRAVWRVAQGRARQPSAVMLESRTLQSSPESGRRAGYEGAKRRRGRDVPIAAETSGQWLALRVTAAKEQARARVAALVAQGQAGTGENVEMAFVGRAYTGEQAAQEAICANLSGKCQCGLEKIDLGSQTVA
jgi:transposase